MVQSCSKDETWTFAVASILLSHYWKTAYWASKQKMDTIGLILGRAMTQSLNRQKEENIYVTFGFRKNNFIISNTNAYC
jgi:hypothetical protein